MRELYVKDINVKGLVLKTEATQSTYGER